jgi:hypothetical protein
MPLTLEVVPIVIQYRRSLRAPFSCDKRRNDVALKWVSGPVIETMHVDKKDNLDDEGLGDFCFRELRTVLKSILLLCIRSPLKEKFKIGTRFQLCSVVPRQWPLSKLNYRNYVSELYHLISSIAYLEPIPIAFSGIVTSALVLIECMVSEWKTVRLLHSWTGDRTLDIGQTVRLPAAAAFCEIKSRSEKPTRADAPDLY